MIRILITLLMLYNICPAAITCAGAEQTGTSGTGASLTSPSITTSAGDVAFVGCAMFNTTPNAVTDSKGNSWAQIGSTQGTTTGVISLWRSVLTSTGAGHTFTCNPAANSDQGIAVMACAGVNSTPDDGNNGGTATSTSISSGNITPSVANDVIVGVTTVDGNPSSITEGTNFTRAFQSLATSSAQPISMEYHIKTDSAAEAATWTLSPSSKWYAVAGMFKPTAAAGCSLSIALLGVGCR